MNSFQFEFEAIGTHWVIDIWDTDSVKDDVFPSIQKRIEIFDKTYSRFREDSLVSQMSKKTGEYMLPSDGESLMKLYKKLYKITDGFFTPLIGSALEQIGYDSKYSLKVGNVEKPLTWEEALQYHDTTLRVKKKVVLDFGAAGKGYLIDIIGDILKQYNIHRFCIDAGGDILYSTNINKPLSVGLENPLNYQEVIGVSTIRNQSLCGSAGNRRKWGSFHHILDPFSLTSPVDILSIWVIAETTMLADALTTCLFFVESEKLEKYFKFEYLILYHDFSIKKSNNFPAKLFLKNQTLEQVQ